jgi:hypothetical protein
MALRELRACNVWNYKAVSCRLIKGLVELQISYDLRSVKSPGCVIATLHVKLSLQQSIAVVDKTSKITKLVYESTEKLSITLM